MTAIALQPSPYRVAAQLHVDRTDIRFRNVTRDLLEIEVDVSNWSEGCSEPTTMRLQAAPLGAFVPWQPLTEVAVPEIEPWGQVTVRTQVSSSRPALLRNSADVTPQDLLTAIGAGTGRPTPRTRALSPGWLPFPRRQRALAAPAGGLARLAADLFALVDRPNPYWAGNINVFIGDCAVERHLAQALRIYPGCTNLALFFVGTGTDAYAFRLSGSGADWEAELYRMDLCASVFQHPESGNALSLGKWIDGTRLRMVMLAVRPPRGCAEGTVEVHVVQRSTGKQAVVEFSLDPNAAGPGCYAI